MFLCVLQPKEGEPYAGFTDPEAVDPEEEKLVKKFPLDQNPGLRALMAIAELSPDNIEALLTQLLRVGIKLGEESKT